MKCKRCGKDMTQLVGMKAWYCPDFNCKPPKRKPPDTSKMTPEELAYFQRHYRY